MRRAALIFFGLFHGLLAALPVTALSAQLVGAGDAVVLAAACPLALSYMAALIPGRRGKVPLRFIALVVMMLFAAAVAFFQRHNITALFCALCAFVLTPLLERAAPRGDDHSKTIQVILFGGGAYIAVGVSAKFMDLSGQYPLIFAGCAAFLCVSAFSLNAASVKSGYAAQKSVKPDRRVMRANALSTIGLLLAVAFVARFQQIRDAVGRAGMAIARGIYRILEWLANLFPGQEVSSGPVPVEEELMDFGEATEPSLLARVMEIVFLVLVCLVLAYLLYKAAPILYRKVKKAFRALMKWLRQYAHSVGGAYLDEHTSLIDADAIRQAAASVRKRVGRLLRRERYDRMSLSQRVRYIVRVLYGRTKADLRAKTLREAIPHLPLKKATPEEVVRIYESVRYGEEAPTDDEVKRLKKEAMV